MKDSRQLKLAALDEVPTAVAEGMLRVDALTQVPDVLRSLGLEPDAILAAAGLDPRVFDDPRNEMSFRGLGHLLDLAVERSGCAHLGLLVGCRAGPAPLGLVGLLTRNSPDVGTALHHLTRHLPLRDGGGVASLDVAGDAALLGYEVCQADVEAADQISDAAIAIGLNVMRFLCGPTWRPSEVHFAHRAPADLRPFRSVFRSRLRFDTGRTALIFPTQWLDQPVRGADPALFRALASRLEALESRLGRDLVVELRRMLRTTLLNGKGSVDEVARRLGMHRRTLNRRLAARGTSLHRLVEATRFQIARQLVEDTRMPLTEVAATLGYADASAFTRAFRRWAGRAPSLWRKGETPAADAKCQAGPRAAVYAARLPRHEGTRRKSS